jgi:hypothetical protein
VVTRDPFPHRSLRAAPRAAALPVPECFADEVAIDFPSVGRAVERIRDSFLREDSGGEDLETELRLSMIEARRGLVVPLEVPMRCMCPMCNGRGGTWRERCDRCAGTGESLYHHQVHVSVPPGVSNGARFRFRVSSPQAAAPVRVELRVAVRSSAA